MNALTIRTAGAGRAYQCVAQSTAIAIQDATDYLRNVSTISTTAIGVAIAQLAGGDPTGNQVITTAQNAMQKAIQNYADVSAAAIKVATDYPKSFT